jgi:hypothetical protein
MLVGECHVRSGKTLLRLSSRLRSAMLAAFAAVPTIAMAVPVNQREVQARELSAMLGAMSLHGARTAEKCQDVPPSSEAGSEAVLRDIPPGLRALFPRWRGGQDVRWLRERAGTFERGFDAVLSDLASTHSEAAERLRKEVAQAIAGGTVPGSSRIPEVADQKVFLSDPERAALFWVAEAG